MKTLSTAAVGAASPSRSDALTAALVAAVFGVGLVWMTGFAWADLLHNAAHDWRHAMAFPCH